MSTMDAYTKKSNHYWIQVLCRVPKALGKGQIALGKAFAECGTRQRTHGKKLIGKALFAECLLSGTRQRKATVMASVPLTVALPSANPAGTRQRFFIFLKKFYLPSAPKFEFFLKNFFAECHLSGTRQSWKNGFPSVHFSSFAECCDHGTRQRGPLPSVTFGKVTQNDNF